LEENLSPLAHFFWSNTTSNNIIDPVTMTMYHYRPYIVVGVGVKVEAETEVVVNDGFTGCVNYTKASIGK